MDYLQSIIHGFQLSLEPINLLYCFIGVFIGTLVGVLPGIGPSGAMAILIPATFHAPPLSTIIMLAGIYYGTMYGGSTTSILVNIPGEASSIITCLDGHQMARQGRAGPALGIAAFGSFIAGTFGTVGLMTLAYPLSRLALKVGPPEYFALMVLGLIIISYLSRKSFSKAVIMGAFGLILSYIGTDPVGGQTRFTFNIDEIYEGVGIIPMVVGIFGIGEVMENLETTIKGSIFETHIKRILPSIKDWADSIWPIIRGSVLGFFLGILPGGGGLLCSFVSYAVEKKVSKHPEEFGKGAIEGVAGPESANNAGCSGAFIPMLTLGIPSNVVTSILFAGLVIHGVTPGPLLISQNPDIFWGVIVSMYIGNIMLLALNLPLIGIWIKLLKVPFNLLFPLIILCCIIGVYSLNNSVFDLFLMIIFGIIGYALKKCDYEFAPFILAYVLGPRLETSLRLSLLMSQGSFDIFLSRPIAAIGLGIAVFLLSMNLRKVLKKRRVGIGKKGQDWQ